MRQFTFLISLALMLVAGTAHATMPTLILKNQFGEQSQNFSISDERAYDLINHSFQILPIDLNLAAAAGSTASNPKFLSPVMGNLIGASLTKQGNYLGGLIGAYSVSGSKATHYGAGGVMGIIMDGVSAADGAFIAVVDGDSGAVNATAALKGMMNNSTAGSGFDYAVDMYAPSHDGFNALAINKGMSRSPNQVVNGLEGSGAPTSGGSGTGLNYAAKGSDYVDYASGKHYVNYGTAASPSWAVVPRILTFTSSASSGGAATEAMVLTGLLSTDTILAVSQSVKGANSLPLLGYNTLAADALTAVWSADPGVGAVIVVTVSR